MHTFQRVLIAFGVGWFTRMLEDSFTTTAWGGPFTVLASWVIIVFLSAVYAVAAVLAGQLLRLPGLQDAWNRAGAWTLLIALPATLVLAFSSALGLRTIDPVSNYSLMSFGPSVLCHFFIVFPIANLPSKRKAVSASPKLQP
jgi:hypothetical protein